VAPLHVLNGVTGKIKGLRAAQGGFELLGHRTRSSRRPKDAAFCVAPSIEPS
jgi:hypothetical protein